MEFSLCPLVFILLFSCSFASIPPSCHENESLALLKFKKSITIDKSVSGDPLAYNKLASWHIGEGRYCCLWDGIECDESTGHVIGLELSSSFLFGSLNSSSTLFTLFHLQQLNLADNSFNYSQIPPEIGSLSELKSLNLSQSNFIGIIPEEISKLSKLVSLDFSYSVDSHSLGRLKLEKPNFESLVQNLTGLKELDLTEVDLSSKVPNILAKLNSLETLGLRQCELYGEFPIGIFHLPKLRFLNLAYNSEITGYLPEFNKSSHLELLILDGISFSGKVPNSIGNLRFLNYLSVMRCNFSGIIPASVGNLTQLTVLDLEDNNFVGQIPSLTGLSKLWFLSLSYNQLEVGTLFWLGSLTSLSDLHLAGIDLNGTVLSTVENDTLLSNTSLPKFKSLFLSSCNLRTFPDFLRHQNEIEILILNYNEIQGRVPTWFSNISKEKLLMLALDNNNLIGFEQHKENSTLPWSNLGMLDISHNNMQGQIPIPPQSIVGFIATNNNLTGNISPLICQSSSLQILELENNSLTGTIPPCLDSFSESLTILNLGSNNLQGPIPQNFKEESKLKLIDFSQNQLTGKVPRSMENCKSLRSLDLSNNLIEDVFPFWLGSLPKLQLLLLGSNNLYGAIGEPKSELDFPNLRICDLSYNNFTGNLPGKYFQTWEAMRSNASDGETYMMETVVLQIHDKALNGRWSVDMPYSMTITNKGVNTNYDYIQSILTAMDFSNNNFEGEIPEIIGNLKGLELLNFSNNGLSGEIPSSLGNLNNLESLDFSVNQLSGKIPQELVQLNFLSLLNISYNNLSGPIPRGNQFNTFQNNSFEGNLGLCGYPLLKKCGAVPISSPPSNLGDDDNDDDFPSRVDWIIIGLGYGSGVIVGIVIGHILIARYQLRFLETFTRKSNKRRRNKRG